MPADGRRRAGRVSHPGRRRAERPGPGRRPGALAVGRVRPRCPGVDYAVELRGTGLPHRRERPAAHAGRARGRRGVRRPGPTTASPRRHGSRSATTRRGHRDLLSRAAAIPGWRPGLPRSPRSGPARSGLTIALHAPIIFPIVFGVFGAAARVSRARPVAQRDPGDGGRRPGDGRERVARAEPGADAARRRRWRT